ncbi:MAG: rhodanese-like domain-containing protein [Burkholderiales bacterium]
MILAGLNRNQLYNVLFLCAAVILFLITDTLLKPSVASVSVDHANALVASNEAIVIDVRDRYAYEKEHLPRALSVPLAELKNRMGEFVGDKAIIVYCNEGRNTGPKATAQLNHAGFAHAVNLEGGIEGWRGAGFRTEK